MRPAALLLVAMVAACARNPAVDTSAGRPMIDIAGIYALRESVYSSDCSPFTLRQYSVEARTNKIRVEVRNTAPYTDLTMTVAVMTYDGQVLPNGRFELKPVTLARNQVTTKESTTGTFSSTGFSAKHVVEATGPAGPCKVTLLWEAEKL